MDMSATTLYARKALLRKEIQAKITKLSTIDKHRQSKCVVQKLLNLPEFQKSQRISCYLSTENEISTDALVAGILAANKQLFVPRFHKNVMQMVKINSIYDWQTLPLTKWNIRQPLFEQQREDAMETGGLDLIIAPGVAFTLTGWRMGHGKGYYDKYLHKLFTTFPECKPRVIGICFNEQIVDDLPKHDHDIQLDQIIHPLYEMQ